MEIYKKESSYYGGRIQNNPLKEEVNYKDIWINSYMN
jgi:hypothetical protein